MLWRQKPSTHEKIGVDIGTVALRSSWVVAAAGVFVWIWSQL